MFYALSIDLHANYFQDGRQLKKISKGEPELPEE